MRRTGPRAGKEPAQVATAFDDGQFGDIPLDKGGQIRLEEGRAGGWPLVRRASGRVERWTHRVDMRLT